MQEWLILAYGVGASIGLLLFVASVVSIISHPFGVRHKRGKRTW